MQPIKKSRPIAPCNVLDFDVLKSFSAGGRHTLVSGPLYKPLRIRIVFGGIGLVNSS